MSKKNVSKKNLKLSNIAIIVAVIAIILIVMSNSIVRTGVILAVGVYVLYLIGKKIDKVKK